MSHRDLVELRIDALMNLATSIKMPTKRPKVVYDLSGRASGTYRTIDNTIRLNERLLIDNLDHFLHVTVGHEFAHAMTWTYYPTSKAHGWEWRRTMRMIGLNPSRVHHYDTSKTVVRINSKMEVQCGCIGPRMLSITKYNRMVLKGAIYTCKNCGHIITKKRRSNDGV